MSHVNRRSFLKATGVGMAYFSLPGAAHSAEAAARRPDPPPSGKIPDESLMREVCTYLRASPTANLPPAVVLKAKHHILDTFAAMVSGADFKVGKLSRDFARAEGGAGQSAVVAEKFLVTARNAALANGNMAHADETDDSHEPSGTHPGCAVIPAALAVAEWQNSSGRAFINAVVAGYDVCCRFNMAAGSREMTRRNHATHSIGGVFGAAAAAASLLRMDEAKIRYTFDYTGQQASGMHYYVRDLEHVEKAFVFGGLPARSGVMAAAMAHAGFTGVWDCFSGEDHVFETFTPEPRPARFIEGLGEKYEIVATNIKKYCVGSPIQAPLEALTVLIHRHGLKPADVRSVAVRVPSYSVVNNREMPDINLQYILAVALIDGGLTFKAAHDFPRMKAPDVMAARAKFTITEDASLRLPHTVRTAWVEVTLNDGRKVSEHITAVPGVAENPMTTAQVEDKCRDILVPDVGSARTEALISAIRDLETLDSVRKLRPILAGA